MADFVVAGADAGALNDSSSDAASPQGAFISSASTNATAASESELAAPGSVTFFKFVSLGVIIAFGSAGNVVVIYALVKNLRRLRHSTPYVLMVGFVSLDLLRVFLCFPVILITVMHRLQWRYGRELCQFMAFVNLFCLFGNTLTLLAMSIDGYISTKYRGFHRRKFKGCLGTTILLTVWAIAFLFSFPAVYGLRSFQFLPTEAQCNLPHHYYENNLEVVGLLLFLLGVFVLTNSVYCKLVVFLRNRRRMRPVVYEPAISDNWSFFEAPGAHPRHRRLATYLSVSAVPLSLIEHHHPAAPLRHDPPSAHPAHRSTAAPGDVYHHLIAERRRTDENLTRVSFIVNAVFATMWTPYIVVCLWYAFHAQNRVAAAAAQPTTLPEWLEITATWLTYFQVAATPLAFFTLTGITRDAVRANQGNSCRRRRREIGAHSGIGG